MARKASVTATTPIPPTPVIAPELTPAEKAGVATHDAIVGGAVAVKDGVVYVGENLIDGATGVFNFLRRTITGA